MKKLKTTIVGAGLSGLLAAKKLISLNNENEITIIEKGKSIIDRIIDLDGSKNYLIPYGEGGKVLFNFKPFLLDYKDKECKEFINILKEYKLYKKNEVIEISDILALIKSLHFELTQKVNIIYENPVVNFYTKNSKLGGVILENGDRIESDNFIFSFGLLDKFLYNNLWKNNVALRSLSTFIPLKTSIELKSIDELDKLNTFIKNKPLISFDGRVSFLDEYQKETNIVTVNSSENLLSYENFSMNIDKLSNHVNFNLNISITESELSSFENSSLRNLALLSLIERNQNTANLRTPILYADFLNKNIFDDILSISMSGIFKKSMIRFFKDFDDDFKSKINIHGISTISLRPIQIISDSNSRSITYPNVIVIGNAKKNFSSLKNKILDTLKTIS
jgi:hypothetical protein